jgi:hypothetical protein
VVGCAVTEMSLGSSECTQGGGRSCSRGPVRGHRSTAITVSGLRLSTGGEGEECVGWSSATLSPHVVVGGGGEVIGPVGPSTVGGGARPPVCRRAAEAGGEMRTQGSPPVPRSAIYAWLLQRRPWEAAPVADTRTPVGGGRRRGRRGWAGSRRLGRRQQGWGTTGAGGETAGCHSHGRERRREGRKRRR